VRPTQKVDWIACPREECAAFGALEFRANINGQRAECYLAALDEARKFTVGDQAHVGGRAAPARAPQAAARRVIRKRVR
jgi:hypothetical protein